VAISDGNNPDISYIAVYKDGVVTTLSPGLIATAANDNGTVGGDVLTDPLNFFTQAALFRGDQVKLIPRQPGEVTSSLIDLNDSGATLVSSFDDSFAEETFLHYKKGQTTVLDFGPSVTAPFGLQINNEGTISGTAYTSENFQNFRGFRFDTRTGKTTLLNPLPTEPDSFALDINNRGKVLGYSFIGGSTERIGTWNKKGEFKTYFVEGTPEFPTISNRLVFNDNNLIVITNVSRPASERGNSYLVPKPGERLNLADLVENLPLDQKLISIRDINNEGDILGRNDLIIDGQFVINAYLLERLDDDE